MGEIGVHKKNKLWFYTPNLAYKVWIKKHKYWVKRVSRVHLWYSSDEIPMVNGSTVNDTLTVLRREALYLTPDEAAIVWAGQDKYDKDNISYEKA